MRISRLYIGILLLCGVGCGFISCGSQKQAVQKKHSVAKVKSKNAVKIPQLSYEQQRQFDYCFSEALRMRRLGEHSAAFEMYKHCLEIQPMDGRTLFDLASYYMSLNLKDKAEEYYKKAVECDPDNFWYKQILANLYEYDKSKYDEAIAVYEDLYKNFPQRNDVLFSLLSLYKKVNDVPNSIRILNEVEAIEGKSEELVMEKMLLLMKLGEKQKAIDDSASAEEAEGKKKKERRIIIAHQGKPLIAVGTTTVRTLESLYWFGVQLQANPQLERMHINQWDPYILDTSLSYTDAYANILRWMENQNTDYLDGETQLMIAPGYRYRIINGLVTNFHQPQSTLLLLVSALIGEQWKACYRYALDHEFRFLSYGDSCLFLK